MINEASFRADFSEQKKKVVVRYQMNKKSSWNLVNRQKNSVDKRHRLTRK